MAQKALYELMSSKMFGVCVRYSNNHEDAQDILQDGFVKVFEKITQYEGKGSFEGWVRRIFVNTALEKFRGQVRIIATEDNLLKLNNIDQHDPVNDQLSEKELLAFIQELSPKYRVVFNLYAIEGYSHKEISDMLDITEGTSKSNLSRARTILQQKVAKYYHQERSVI
ncbi:MAG: sigma-70 family RNA polymerase sigma factor [Bacteroidetes bacterium]|nr:sigma-70 family RNA polymerase sigma factor [Bacteroidota bacterium]